jgi:mannose-1-phosphate guanylyltransferase
MLHAMIIAGGLGKRLWPRSRRQYPKSFLRVKGTKTLLEQAINRARMIMPVENIIIITNSYYVNLVHKTLPGFPKKNIIAEPLSRNTAPAICLGSALIKERDPDSVVYAMPADQVIEDGHAIAEVFKLSAMISRINDSIITVGIKPGFASAGYGYIKTAGLYKGPGAGRGYDVFKVEHFVEKPDIKKAKRFIKTKRYLWNSGIFIAKADVILGEFKTHSPQIYKTALKITGHKGAKGLKHALSYFYKDFPEISVDYAIMEKTDKAFVIKADPGWSDIGSWTTLQRYLSRDRFGNAVDAEHVGIDTGCSVIIGEKDHIIATAGIKDMVIVQTKDATLVCPKDNTEDVKRLVEIMKKKGLKRYI